MYSEDGTAYLRITDRVFCKDRPGFRQNPVGFILGLGPTGFHDKPVGFVIPVPNRPGYTENPTGFDIYSMQGGVVSVVISFILVNYTSNLVATNTGRFKSMLPTLCPPSILFLTHRFMAFGTDRVTYNPDRVSYTTWKVISV